MVNMCFSSGFSDAPMVCPKPVKPGLQFLHRLPIPAGQVDFQVGLTAFPQAPRLVKLKLPTTTAWPRGEG